MADVEGARLRVRLRELRGERTLTEVAGLIGIRGDELGRIERGETVQIRFSTLLRILTALNCRLDELLEVERSQAPQPRYAAALRAAVAGELSVPDRAGTLRDSSAYEQDLSEAEAFASDEVHLVGRKAVGTLNP